MSSPQPIYLSELYAVEEKQRPGWAAILRLDSGTSLHCSRMAEDATWFIDAMFTRTTADPSSVWNNGYGERRSERAELHPLNAKIGAALDMKLEERGLKGGDKKVTILSE